MIYHSSSMFGLITKTSGGVSYAAVPTYTTVQSKWWVGSCRASDPRE